MIIENKVLFSGFKQSTLFEVAGMIAGKVEWNMESISVAEIIKRATAVTSSNFNKTS